MPMTPNRLHQALFSEFFIRIVERFGHAIRVKHQRVTGTEIVFPERAIPFFE